MYTKRKRKKGIHDMDKKIAYYRAHWYTYNEINR